jgi:hypothetical protein
VGDDGGGGSRWYRKSYRKSYLKSYRKSHICHKQSMHNPNERQATAG